MSQLVLILDWNWLVVVFQKLLLRFWDVDLFLPQLLFSLLSEGSMMREGFVAQLNLFQSGVMFIYALKVRVVDAGLWRLGDLKSQRYPDRDKSSSHSLCECCDLTDFP